MQARAAQTIGLCALVTLTGWHSACSNDGASAPVGPGLEDIGERDAATDDATSPTAEGADAAPSLNAPNPASAASPGAGADLTADTPSAGEVMVGMNEDAGIVPGSGGEEMERPPGSAGCGLDAPPSGDASIDVGGVTGSYILSIPEGYEKNRPYPLIFGFHGAGVDPARFRMYFDLTGAVGPDAIAVYPHALGDARAWSDSRDIPYFDALLAKLLAQLCVDPSRVFAGGHSSGGFMTHALGCKRGDVLRGIAPLSAGPPRSSDCVGQVAVWISHGAADPTVRIESGRQARDFWLGRNHCDESAFTPVEPAPTVDYAGCDPGFGVRYCEYDGEHNLPRYAPAGFWSFFKSLP